MKKTLFFILILLIISCSGDDDNNDNQTANFINPPEWIIGTWLDESEPAFSQIGGFHFTNDNLIDLNSN